MGNALYSVAEIRGAAAVRAAAALRHRLLSAEIERHEQALRDLEDPLRARCPLAVIERRLRVRVLATLRPRLQITIAALRIASRDCRAVTNHATTSQTERTLR